ncbi:MAG TPA: aldehyde dehydrogenase family protein [Thermoanaerobaculia bacterium]|nr:aldehyde dehydrogenase family protein [Thermoanaerobaculia bacterium]
MDSRDRALRIGGEEITTGDWIDVHSPWSGERLARVAKAGPPEIDRAIAAAVEGFEETRGLPAHRRAEILRRLRDELEKHHAEFVETIVAEAGKPRRYAEAEVERGLMTLRLASEEATRLEGEVVPVDIEPRGEGAFCAVRRFPVGPVTAITPFNFPLNLALHKVAPALAAGNPVILKPSPRTPLTADLLARAVEGSGWPKKAFSLVHADPQVARPLWTDERIRCVSFTGSDVVGWKIKEEAARKKVILELGGNAAAIVSEYADVEAAARKLATAAFAYAGQVCIKAQRLFIARPVYERFVSALLAATKKIEPADPADPAAVLGPMIDEENAERVESWVEEAKRRGAKLLVPQRREGAKLWPIVASEVPEGAKLRDREVFGPVATVEPFDRFEDALAKANDSLYGLQASVFTRDIAEAMKAFEKLEVGGVIINEAPTMRIDNFPYGGTKASGFGREGVRYAVEEMTEPRVLFLRPGAPSR